MSERKTNPSAVEENYGANALFKNWKVTKKNCAFTPLFLYSELCRPRAKREVRGSFHTQVLPLASEEGGVTWNPPVEPAGSALGQRVPTETSLARLLGGVERAWEAALTHRNRLECHLSTNLREVQSEERAQHTREAVSRIQAAGKLAGMTGFVSKWSRGGRVRMPCVQGSRSVSGFGSWDQQTPMNVPQEAWR